MQIFSSYPSFLTDSSFPLFFLLVIPTRLRLRLIRVDGHNRHSLAFLIPQNTSVSHLPTAAGLGFPPSKPTIFPPTHGDLFSRVPFIAAADHTSISTLATLTASFVVGLCPVRTENAQTTPFKAVPNNRLSRHPAAVDGVFVCLLRLLDRLKPELCRQQHDFACQRILVDGP